MEYQYDIIMDFSIAHFSCRRAKRWSFLFHVELSLRPPAQPKAAMMKKAKATTDHHKKEEEDARAFGQDFSYIYCMKSTKA